MLSWIFKKENGIFLALIIAGFFLRLLFLEKNDLWYDEAAYIAIAMVYTVPPFVFFNRPFGPLNPPLSYLFGKMWGIFIYRFGWNEWILRLPCALAAFNSLLILYFLTVKMFNKRVALIAIALMALNPFHLWYAQDISNYSVAIFGSLFTSFFLYSFLKNKTTEALVLYIASVSMLLYGYYLGILLYACQLFIVVDTDNIDLRKKLCVFIPAFLFLPIIPFFFNSLSLIQGGFWIPKPTPASALITFENFILGYNGTDVLYFLIDILICFTFVSIVKKLLKKNSSDEKQEINFCLFLSLLPIALAYVYSLFYSSIYLDRALIIFSPYFYILVAWSLEKIRHRFVKIMTLSVLFITLIIGVIRYYSNQMYAPYDLAHHQGTYLKKPYKPLVAFLKKNLRQDDLIGFGNEHSIPPFVYYYTYDSPYESLRPDLVKISSFFFYAVDPTLINTNWQRPAEKFYGPSAWLIKKDNLLGYLKNRRAKRVFLLGHDNTRSGNLDQNSKNIRDFFNEHLRLLNVLDFDGIKLFIYDCRNLNTKNIKK